MRSKSDMRNIILIISLNIVFLLSMWNCKDKSDEIRKCNDELFKGMCEEYPQLLENLSGPKYDDSVKTIIPQKVNSNNIYKRLWALFEITLIDDIGKETGMNNNEILLKSIVNEQFLILKRSQCSFYFSLFSEGDIPSNRFYLFVSDIETTYKVGVPISLFRGCNKIKEIKVVCSAFPDSMYDICYLFRNCENLVKVDLENLTLNRLEIGSLFKECKNLEEVIFQKSNGDKENLYLSTSTIFECFQEDFGGEMTIKVSCTDYFAYLLFSQTCICNKYKSFFMHNNCQKFINDSGEELKNGNCYRTFTIVLENGVYF